MEIQTKSTTTKFKTIKINREDIVRFLKEKNHIDDEDDVKRVYVQVPGGVDYSNCDLDIGEGFDDIPIIVEIKETSETS